MSAKSVPITVRVGHRPAKEILVRDTARSHKINNGANGHGPNARHHGGVGNHTIALTDASLDYTITVEIGDPPTEFTLLLDTGRYSQLWKMIGS